MSVTFEDLVSSLNSMIDALENSGNSKNSEDPGDVRLLEAEGVSSMEAPEDPSEFDDPEESEAPEEPDDVEPREEEFDDSEDPEEYVERYDFRSNRILLFLGAVLSGPLTCAIFLICVKLYKDYDLRVKVTGFLMPIFLMISFGSLNFILAKIHSSLLNSGNSGSKNSKDTDDKNRTTEASEEPDDVGLLETLEEEDPDDVRSSEFDDAEDPEDVEDPEFHYNDKISEKKQKMIEAFQKFCFDYQNIIVPAAIFLVSLLFIEIILFIYAKNNSVSKPSNEVKQRHIPTPAELYDQNQELKMLMHTEWIHYANYMDDFAKLQNSKGKRMDLYLETPVFKIFEFGKTQKLVFYMVSRDYGSVELDVLTDESSLNFRICDLSTKRCETRDGSITSKFHVSPGKLEVQDFDGNIESIRVFISEDYTWPKDAVDQIPHFLKHKYN